MLRTNPRQFLRHDSRTDLFPVASRARGIIRWRNSQGYGPPRTTENDSLDPPTFPLPAYFKEMLSRFPGLNPSCRGKIAYCAGVFRVFTNVARSSRFTAMFPKWGNPLYYELESKMVLDWSTCAMPALQARVEARQLSPTAAIRHKRPRHFGFYYCKRPLFYI